MVSKKRKSIPHAPCIGTRPEYSISIMVTYPTWTDVQRKVIYTSVRDHDLRMPRTKINKARQGNYFLSAYMTVRYDARNSPMTWNHQKSSQKTLVSDEDERERLVFIVSLGHAASRMEAIKWAIVCVTMGALIRWHPEETTLSEPDKSHLFDWDTSWIWKDHLLLLLTSVTPVASLMHVWYWAPINFEICLFLSHHLNIYSRSIDFEPVSMFRINLNRRTSQLSEHWTMNRIASIHSSVASDWRLANNRKGQTRRNSLVLQTILSSVTFSLILLHLIRIADVLKNSLAVGRGFLVGCVYSVDQSCHREREITLLRRMILTDFFTSTALVPATIEWCIDEFSSLSLAINKNANQSSLPKSRAALSTAMMYWRKLSSATNDDELTFVDRVALVLII